MKVKLTKGLNINPSLPLRIGLGGTFIYAGLSIITSPERWIGFIPEYISHLITESSFIIFYGILEIALGILLLSGFFISLVSFIAFVNLLFIIAFFGINDTTFRDFGLSMAALTLFILSLTLHPFKNE
jgi:uncharacterized membrane protein YphA (DoxX/SURF4 family)